MALASSNIKISDVKTALGETTNSLKSLCTSDKINKWSLWKPIQYNSSITESIIYQKNGGFTFPKYSSVEELTDTYLDSSSDITWTYNKPTSNYRLGDFRNYDHSAKSFCQYNITYDGNLYTVTFDNLSKYLRDFTPLQEYIECGFIVYKEDKTGNQYYIHSGPFDKNQGNIQVSMKFNVLNSGRYYAIPVLVAEPTASEFFPNSGELYYKSDMYDLPCVALDSVKRVVEYTGSSSSKFYNNLSCKLIYSYTVSEDSNGNTYVTINSLGLEIENENSTSYDIRIVVNNNGYYDDTRNMYDSTVTVGSNSTTSISSLVSENREWIKSPEHPILHFTFTTTVSGSNYTGQGSLSLPLNQDSGSTNFSIFWY